MHCIIRAMHGHSVGEVGVVSVRTYVRTDVQQWRMCTYKHQDRPDTYVFSRVRTLAIFGPSGPWAIPDHRAAEGAGAPFDVRTYIGTIYFTFGIHWGFGPRCALMYVSHVRTYVRPLAT